MKKLRSFIACLLAVATIAVANPTAPTAITSGSEINIDSITTSERDRIAQAQAREAAGLVPTKFIRLRNATLKMAEQQFGDHPRLRLAIYDVYDILSNDSLNINGTQVDDLWLTIENTPFLTVEKLINICKSFNVTATKRWGFGYLNGFDAGGGRAIFAPDEHLYIVLPLAHLAVGEVGFVPSSASIDLANKELMITGPVTHKAFPDAQITITEVRLPEHHQPTTIPVAFTDATAGTIPGRLTIPSAGKETPIFTSDQPITLRQETPYYSVECSGRYQRSAHSHGLVSSATHAPASLSLRSADGTRAIMVRNETIPLGFGKGMHLENAEFLLVRSGRDTISHPTAMIDGNLSEGKITITIPDNAARKATPFHSKLGWLADARTLEIDAKGLKFSGGNMIDQEHTMLTLYSENYFCKKDHAEFELCNGANLANRIELQTRKAPNTTITVASLMQNMPPSARYTSAEVERSMRSKLAKLVDANYIRLDDEGIIYPTKHLLHMARASQGVAAYDTLKIEVQGKKNGGQVFMDWSGESMTVIAPEPFLVTKNMAAYPTDSLLLKQNHDMEFVGFADLGKLRLQSEQALQIDYRAERMDFVNANITVLDLRNESDPYLANTRKLKIQNATGSYFIRQYYGFDAPSKEKKLPTALQVSSVSNVYFPDACGGAYGTAVRFSIDPYSLYDVANLSSADLMLPGQFISPIFQNNFRARLSPITIDGVPTIGVLDTFKVFTPIYGNASLKGRVMMSLEKGLNLEDGEIRIGNALITGDHNLLLPDRLLATDAHFVLRSSDDLMPDIDVICNVTYLPAVDEITLTMANGKPIALFDQANGERSLLGELKITSRGVIGNGTLILNDDLKITSDSLHIGAKQVHGLARVDVHDALGERIFAIKDVLVSTNVNSGATDMRMSNASQSKMACPIAQLWLDGLEEAHYDRNTGKVGAKGEHGHLHNKAGLDLNLRTMLLDRATGEITLGGVSHIAVGDAELSPANEIVSIKREGNIVPIANCAVHVGRHQIQGSVQIQDSATYQAVGELPYTYLDGRRVMLPITLTGKQGRTIGHSTIAPSDNFMLSKRTAFVEGTITLNPLRNHLHFEGQAELHSSLPALNGRSVAISADAGSDSVTIKLPENLDQRSGLFSNANGQIFPAFLHAKKDNALRLAGNVLIETPTGYALRDAQSELVLDEDAQEVRFTADKIEIPLPPKAELVLKASGTWKSDFTGLKTSADVDLNIALPSLDAGVFKAINKALLAIDADRVAGTEAISYPRTILLEQVHLKYDPSRKAHVATGEALLVGIDNNSEIAQKVQLLLQINTSGEAKGQSMDLIFTAHDNAAGVDGPRVWLHVADGATQLYTDVPDAMLAIDPKQSKVQPMVNGAAELEKFETMFRQRLR